MMNGNGIAGDGMMWGMGLTGTVGLLMFVLILAALIKYVFFR